MSNLARIFALDLRSIRAFRFLLGLLVAAYALDLEFNASYFFSDTGIFPRWYFSDSFDRVGSIGHWATISPLFWSGSATYSSAFFLGLMLLGFGLSLLHFPRLISWAIFICMTSALQRAPYTNYGGDDFIRALALWSAILPQGRFDREEKWQVKTWATAGVIGQILVVYLASGYAKSNFWWFWNPWGAYLALSMDQLVTPMGVWLRQFPGLLKAATVSTLLSERFVVLLLLVPRGQSAARIFVFLWYAAMHIAFALGLRLLLFSPAAITMLVLILPGTFWDKAQKILGTELFRTPPLESGRERKYSLFFSKFWVPIWIALICLLNLAGGPSPIFSMGANLKWWLNFSGIRQRWNMFAPVPSRQSGWFTFTGKTSSGKEVDPVFLEFGPESQGAARAEHSYLTYRWALAASVLFPSASGNNPELGNQIAQYLCDRWNTKFSETPMTEVRIRYFLDYTQPPGISRATSSVDLMVRPCIRISGVMSPIARESARRIQALMRDPKLCKRALRANGEGVRFDKDGEGQVDAVVLSGSDAGDLEAILSSNGATRKDEGARMSLRMRADESKIQPANARPRIVLADLLLRDTQGFASVPLAVKVDSAGVVEGCPGMSAEKRAEFQCRNANSPEADCPNFAIAQNCKKNYFVGGFDEFGAPTCRCQWSCSF